MRDAIAALQAALVELENARSELPEDLSTEITEIIGQSRAVLDSLRAKTAATGDSDRADATG